MTPLSWILIGGGVVLLIVLLIIRSQKGK